MNPRSTLAAALEGKKAVKPICACYDAFASNNAVDWKSLFNKGLVLIDHVEIIDTENPNLHVREEISIEGTRERRDVYWETGEGILHEYYLRDLKSHLLPWRMEHFIKENSDYQIMQSALEGSEFSICPPRHLFYDPLEEGIDADSCFQIASMDRTPLQKVQIDFTNLEKFSIDFAFKKPELMNLIEMMNDQLYDKFNLIKDSDHVDLKLWENLTIDVLGPHVFREQLVPVYRQINKILQNHNKRLHVHYDGKMNLIINDIADLDFAGIDSFSAGPEGDVDINKAVGLWRNTFLWINPAANWYSENTELLRENIRSVCSSISSSMFCFVISEDLPPNPYESIAAILDTLNELQNN
jgi:hypothetical protein